MPNGARREHRDLADARRGKSIVMCASFVCFVCVCEFVNIPLNREIIRKILVLAVVHLVALMARASMLRLAKQDQYYDLIVAYYRCGADGLIAMCGARSV